MPRELREYPLLLGEADLEKVKALHKLTGEFKDSFLTDHKLQDLLLNRGYMLENHERPTSFRRYTTAINGMKTCCHLDFLDAITNAVQKPVVVTFSRKPIILPGESDELEIKTLDGYDAIEVEELQTAWMENPKARNLVRQYKNILEQALDEYSMQFILGRIEYSRQGFLPDEPSFQTVRASQQKASEAFDKKSYVILDDAYYNKGTNFFRSAGRVYEQLQADSLGSKFILSIEEEQQALAMWDKAHIG